MGKEVSNKMLFSLYLLDYVMACCFLVGTVSFAFDQNIVGWLATGLLYLGCVLKLISFFQNERG